MLRIEEPSAVAEARRHLRRVAADMGASPELTERAAIVATEVCTNILRHAGRGRLLVQQMPIFGHRRLVILAMDQGPGIARLDRMMEDGVSTAGSSGTGLGAMQRLSDRFDVLTEPDLGTVVACEFEDGKTPYRPDGGTDVAAIRVNHPGETICGDSWAVREHGGTAELFLCDGLGHGASAAEASELAARQFLKHPRTDPGAIIADLSDDLTATRGAVAALCRISPKDRKMIHAGLGNISTLRLGPRQVKRVPSRDGRLGGTPRSPLVETSELDPGNMIIMHSDGITTLRNIEARPALYRASPLAVAGAILRDNFRGRDDAGIVVARMGIWKTAR
ncbi:ATP-binding protein [Brevirhabdus sp.]|uniref:ATP-binding protein n=1 Tax=Brevirhabdus sp. TaxID=2004514 RepID=UPI004059EF19